MKGVSYLIFTKPFLMARRGEGPQQYIPVNEYKYSMRHTSGLKFQVAEICRENRQTDQRKKIF